MLVKLVLGKRKGPAASDLLTKRTSKVGEKEFSPETFIVATAPDSDFGSIWRSFYDVGRFREWCLLFSSPTWNSRHHSLKVCQLIAHWRISDGWAPDLADSYVRLAWRCNIRSVSQTPIRVSRRPKTGQSIGQELCHILASFNFGRGDEYPRNSEVFPFHSFSCGATLWNNERKHPGTRSSSFFKHTFNREFECISCPFRERRLFFANDGQYGLLQ